MRVTMLNKYYPPHLGGIEFHMRDLAEKLASSGAAEVSALVANEGPGDIRETIAGVEVTRLSRLVEYASTPVAPGMARSLRGLAASATPPDVLHLHFP